MPRCASPRRFDAMAAWCSEEGEELKLWGVLAGCSRDGSSEPAGMEPVTPAAQPHPAAGTVLQNELCCWMGSRAAPGLPESALRPSLIPPPPVHPLAQEAFFIIINSYCKPVKSFMGFG